MKNPKDEQEENQIWFVGAFSSHRLQAKKKKQDCDGNITRWVTHISPSTPWKEQAKRKEGFDLVVLTRGNTDAQRGQVISSTTDGHTPGCSIQEL